MGKFILGAVLGGVLVAVFASSHPKETHSAVTKGENAIAQGAVSGANAAKAEAQKHINK